MLGLCALGSAAQGPSLPWAAPSGRSIALPNLRELRLDQDLVKTSSSNQQALGAHANAALCAMATMYRRSTSTSNYQSYHPHTKMKPAQETAGHQLQAQETAAAAKELAGGDGLMKETFGTKALGILRSHDEAYDIVLFSDFGYTQALADHAHAAHLHARAPVRRLHTCECAPPVHTCGAAHTCGFAPARRTPVHLASPLASATTHRTTRRRWRWWWRCSG